MERLWTLLLAEAAPTRALAVGGLLAVRLAPLTLVVPALAVRGTPPLVRTTILLAFVLGLLPTALAASPELPDDVGHLAVLSLREAALGASLAFVVAVPFLAIEHAGRIIDAVRGAAQGELSLPSGDRTSMLGAATSLFAVVLFSVSGGLELLVRVLAETVQASPPGAGGTALDAMWLAEQTARLVTLVLTAGVSLAAPAIVALVVADAGLGLVARTAPQLPVYFAAMPLRAWLGLAALLLALAWLVPSIPESFDAFLGAARDLARPAR